MGLFSKLFDKGESPTPRYVDPELGALVWDEESESWFGEFSEVRFSVAYERKAKAEPDLVSYARGIIGDSSLLSSAITTEKKKWIDENGKALTEEVSGLKLGRLHFYRHKGVFRIIGDLDGGLRDRCWRIEFRERSCEGIGFDS